MKFILSLAAAFLLVSANAAIAQMDQNQNQQGNQPSPSMQSTGTQTTGGTQDMQGAGIFQGDVLAIEQDSLTLQDLSTGITTTYTVSDSAILQDLKPGDRVTVQADGNRQATDVQKQNQ